MLAHGILTLFLILFNAIYSLFSHGVDSNTMQTMYLIPLLGGCGFFLLLNTIPRFPEASAWKLFTHLYHTGMALGITYCLLFGILEIAGTSSVYTVLFFQAGVLFLGASLVALVRAFLRQTTL